MASQDEGTSSHGLSCVEGATVNVFAIDTIAIASFLCASVVTLLLFAPILFFSSESNPLWYDTTDCVLVKKEPFKTATNAFAARFYVQYEATKGQVLRSSFSLCVVTDVRLDSSARASARDSCADLYQNNETYRCAFLRQYPLVVTFASHIADLFRTEIVSTILVLGILLLLLLIVCLLALLAVRRFRSSYSSLAALFLCGTPFDQHLKPVVGLFSPGDYQLQVRPLMSDGPIQLPLDSSLVVVPFLELLRISAQLRLESVLYMGPMKRSRIVMLGLIGVELIFGSFLLVMLARVVAQLVGTLFILSLLPYGFLLLLGVHISLRTYFSHGSRLIITDARLVRLNQRYWGHWAIEYVSLSHIVQVVQDSGEADEMGERATGNGNSESILLHLNNGSSFRIVAGIETGMDELAAVHNLIIELRNRLPITPTEQHSGEQQQQ